MKTYMILLSLFLASSAFAEQHTTIEKQIPVGPSQRIQIEGFSGSDIRLRSWSKNEISVHLRVSISSSSDEYERRYIEGVKIFESSTGGDLRVRLTEEEMGKGESFFSRLFHNFYINKTVSGEIYVPQSNPLTTDFRYGALSLDNMKGEIELLGTSNTLALHNCTAIRTVENNYGTTTIEGSGGEMRLTGTSSTVTVTDFIGSINLDVDYSTVTVARVTKNVTIRDQSGRVDVDSVGGNVKLKTDYSTIAMSGIKGFAEVRCTSGKVQARTVGGIAVDAKYSDVELFNIKNPEGKPIIIGGASGKLTLEDASGDVRIDNPYSTITLNKISGDVTIATTSGTVDADNITGDWTSRTQYSNVTVRRLSAKNITITNSSNPVVLSLRTVPSVIDIRNQYGAVTVNMPSGFSGNVDMTSEYGNIETNLPVKIKTLSSSAYAVGKVGSGSGTITIETKSADVRLKEE